MCPLGFVSLPENLMCCSLKKKAQANTKSEGNITNNLTAHSCRKGEKMLQSENNNNNKKHLLQSFMNLFLYSRTPWLTLTQFSLLSLSILSWS